MKVYLAGPIANAQANGRVWRESLDPWYDDVEFLNPLDKYDDTASYDDMRDEWSAEDVVDADLKLIRESDGVFVRYVEGVPSYGTPCEVFYAFHDLGKPIAVWTDAEELPLWLEGMNDYHHFNKFEVMDYLVDAIETEKAVQAGIAAKRKIMWHD